jgi:sugar lactone lactonase YvrE
MFTPADLAQSQRTTPTRVLVPDRVDIPAGITFDRAGNLWMTDASFTLDRNFVLAFTPQDQTIGGLRAPILRLSSGAFALVEGLQFDARGDLWVANNDGFTVVRFAAARLELPFGPSVRTLAPDTALESDADDSPTGRTVRKPGGLAFDRDGNLFVNSQRGANPSDISAVVQFSAAQLAALEQPDAVQARTIISFASANPGFGGLALEME